MFGWRLIINDYRDYEGIWGEWLCIAETRGKAKRRFASNEGMAFTDVRVQREPAIDGIEYVTDRVVLYFGLYGSLECTNCSRRIYADIESGDVFSDSPTLDGDDEFTPAVVDWRGRFYCSERCVSQSSPSAPS